MDQLSFAYVPTEGFTAFRAELDSGDWGKFDISSYEGVDGRAAKPLVNAPTIVVMKLQLTWSVGNLVEIVEGAVGAKQMDDRWGGVQKRLHSLIAVGRTAKDPLVRAAAERLRQLMLLGNGEQQTRLRYQQEVDFGRKQVLLASQGQCAADIALLGLATVITDIDEATTALASVIGHGVTGLSPSRRKRAATANCIYTFGAVLHALDWMVDFGQAGADHEQAIALRAPLVELAKRYPTAPPLKKSPKENTASTKAVA